MSKYQFEIANRDYLDERTTIFKDSHISECESHPLQSDAANDDSSSAKKRGSSYNKVDSSSKGADTETPGKTEVK